MKERENLWDNVNEIFDKADKMIADIIKEYGITQEDGSLVIDVSDYNDDSIVHLEDKDGYYTIISELVSASINKKGEVHLTLYDDENACEVSGIELTRLLDLYSRLEVLDALKQYEELVWDEMYDEIGEQIKNEDEFPNNLLEIAIIGLSAVYSGRLEDAKVLGKDSLYGFVHDLFGMAVKILEEKNKAIAKLAEEENTEDTYWWDDYRDEVIEYMMGIED